MKFIPKIIKNETEHEAALVRISQIFDARPGTREGDELELLVLLTERYEDEQYSMDLPDPLTAIRFRMEQAGLKQKDLATYLGSESKVSEVMSGRRSLSLTMVKNLVHGLQIPADIFVQIRPATERKTIAISRTTRKPKVSNSSAKTKILAS